MLAGGIPLSSTKALLGRSVVRNGDRADFSRHRTGVTVGCGNKWTYSVDGKRVPDADHHCMLWDERIFDRILSANRPVSISQLAIDFSWEEKALRPIVEGLVDDGYLQAVSDTMPQEYEAVSDAQINHGYPRSPLGFYARMVRADFVARQAREQNGFTYVVQLTKNGADYVYSQIRDYELVLPVEERLNCRLAETQKRMSLPVTSTFGAILLFSPDIAFDGCIAHYLCSKERWHNIAFEILPYRFALDGVAIDQFLREDREVVANATSDMLDRAKSIQGGEVNSYRFSFFCSSLKE